MKTFYKSLIVIFYFFIVLNSNAQNHFDVEIYGGLNKNYFQAGESSTFPEMDFSIPLAQHVGLNFLPRITENWQMSIQTEWMRSAIRLGAPEFNSRNIYNSYGNYAIGARYNLDRGNKAFYFQPGIGISINNFTQVAPDGFRFEYRRDVQVIARGEVGVKFYNSKRNYFLVGLRHQQGFGSTEPYGAQGIFDMPISGRNSYTGIFMGYGINTDNWFKSKREIEKTPRLKREHPWADGIYIMGSASLRRVFNPIKDVADDFQNVSVASMAGIGYRYGDFSMETGYAGFRGRNVYQLLSPEGIPINTSHRSFSVATIPITLRYDRRLPLDKNIRLGASFTTHIPVSYQNPGEDFTSVSGIRTLDNVEFPYEKQVTGLMTTSQDVLFNSGIYTEMPFFGAGLLTFKASINYGSPIFDRAQVNYQVNGLPDAFESQGNLNGMMLEMEYRLPLHHIFKK